MLKARKSLNQIPVYETDEYFVNFELKLDKNENLFGVNYKVLNAIKNIDEDTIRYYPAQGMLLDEISKKYLIDKKSIILTSGKDDAIRGIFSAYLEKNENVVSYYETSLKFNILTFDMNVKINHVKADSELVFDVKKLDKIINNKTKIIYLSSPNSITGDIISVDEVSYFLKKYPNKLILLDISYLNFVEQKIDYFKLLEDYKNLFILKSFSKDYGMAGLKIAFVVSDSLNILNLKKVILPNSVNSVAISSLVFAINDDKYLFDLKNDVKLSRKLLQKGLSELGFKPYHGYANFVLCDFSKYADYIYKKLLINSIKVKRFYTNDHLKNCFRITTPKSKDVQKLLNVLKPRNLFVFNMDDVLFNCAESYQLAIVKTFEYFAFKTIGRCEIEDEKNFLGLESNVDITYYLLKKYNIEATKTQVEEIFNNYFYNKKNSENRGLIDNEKLLLTPFQLEKLSKKFDLAIYSTRNKELTEYSLKKFDILKYFSLIVTSDDFKVQKQNKSVYVMNFIKNNSHAKNVLYFFNSLSDIKCTKIANVVPVGVLGGKDDSEKYKKLFYKHGVKNVLSDISEIVKVKV